MQTQSWYMTSDQYLENIIRQKSIYPIQLTDFRLNRITNLIRNWSGVYLNSIKLSGSSAKNLIVSGESDIDIFISLKSDTPQDLKTIFNSLATTLQQNYLPAEKHTVALQTRDNNLKIDLVPGKIQSGYQNWHSLYNSVNDSWLQTNIDDHINKVINSGRQNEIRAIKIWSKINSLKFPSIYLELVVFEALFNKSKNQLANNVQTVLEYLSSQFVDKRIVDPSNSNNIISDYALTKPQKEAIARKAKTSLTMLYWESVIY